MIGRVLNGKYRIDKEVGSGAFGKIYKCSHVETGVDYAVKLVRNGIKPILGISFD